MVAMNKQSFGKSNKSKINNDKIINIKIQLIMILSYLRINQTRCEKLFNPFLDEIIQRDFHQK